MRTSFIAVVVLAVLAGAASASDYVVGFYADEDALGCEISNTTPELITIHMFLIGDGRTAKLAQFAAPTPACWEAVWLGDEVNDEFIFLGNTHDLEGGIAIAFGRCKTLPVRLGSMGFYAEGSDPCCEYEGHGWHLSHSGRLEVVDCDMNLLEASSTSVIINPDETCTCSSSSLVATEPTSWGRVKALYR